MATPVVSLSGFRGRYVQVPLQAFSFWKYPLFVLQSLSYSKKGYTFDAVS